MSALGLKKLLSMTSAYSAEKLLLKIILINYKGQMPLSKHRKFTQPKNKGS
jgi:hypothetical protein